MGNWNIIINGIGQHHNKRDPRDANRIAAEFVQKLKDAGHTVYFKSFTYGGADDIDGKAYLETQDELEK